LKKAYCGFVDCGLWICGLKRASPSQATLWSYPKKDEISPQRN
jgi:hypothetical protein